MKKIVRLTESDLVRIVKKIVRESEDDYDDDYTREMSLKDKNFKYNKSGLERTIERFDSVEKIIKLLGGEVFTNKNLKHYKPLGLTSVDALVDYKNNYKKDEY